MRPSKRDLDLQRILFQFVNGSRANVDRQTQIIQKQLCKRIDSFSELIFLLIIQTCVIHQPFIIQPSLEEQWKLGLGDVTSNQCHDGLNKLP